MELHLDTERNAPKGTQKHLMLRGSEWYVMRDAKIAEVRAYFVSADDGHAELAGFPYGERGYLTLEDQSPQVRRSGAGSSA
jgi:hypothetical protein